MNKTKTDRLWSDLQAKFGVSLDDDNLAKVRAIFHPRTMKKNDFFIREGEKSTEIGLIMKGAFRSFYINEQGHDMTKYFYVEGDLILSYLAYISQKKSAYSIQALENSEIFVASIHDWEKIVDENYQLLSFYKRMVDTVLVMKEEHATSFKLWNSTERYNNFCASYPELNQRIKQCHLASYLGITPVSLSRIRTKQNLNK
ncbi:Crp/Fnr family transcriptional regulator [Bacillus sp. WMMC1349]|uniref:Crp/Fnr family transcriptional regulator n=1 Tax=Bacillus sp. WMMC1349 TaxID=2736254 RepID=UPI0015544D9B|nr:Crp/Fnr family transcriptional regulator [Bacillus sp. WMMC1349]NPC91864.1 Crp/Fnr family transcriptional regulator [Bacillus sp. WMMC1349]